MWGAGWPGRPIRQTKAPETRLSESEGYESPLNSGEPPSSWRLLTVWEGAGLNPNFPALDVFHRGPTQFLQQMAFSPSLSLSLILFYQSGQVSLSSVRGGGGGVLGLNVALSAGSFTEEVLPVRARTAGRHHTLRTNNENRSLTERPLSHALIQAREAPARALHPRLGSVHPESGSPSDICRGGVSFHNREIHGLLTIDSVCEIHSRDRFI